MSSKIGEITEEEVAFIVTQIAANRDDGIASFEEIRDELPRRRKLSSADLVVSTTRPKEAMWEQKVRNIKSHDTSPGNYISEGFLEHVPEVGYRVTARGLKLANGSAA